MRSGWQIRSKDPYIPRDAPEFNTKHPPERDKIETQHSKNSLDGIIPCRIFRKQFLSRVTEGQAR
jgi:hypothetical protein